MRLKAMIEVLESNNKNPHEHENSGNFVKLFETFYVDKKRRALKLASRNRRNRKRME